MATVLVLAGAFGLPSMVYDFLRGDVLQGNDVKPLFYPNFTIDYMGGGAQGAEVLNDALISTPGPKIVFAHSLGAVVGNRWLRDYGQSAFINPADLNFIFMGNSVRRYGGFLFAENLAAPIDTPFSVVDLARQYDGWCDWPNDLANTNFEERILAGANATLGANSIHTKYQDVGIEDDNNLFYTEGNITYILSPTRYCPIVDTNLLSQSGKNIKDQEVRPKIEAGYDRSRFGTPQHPGYPESPPPSLEEIRSAGLTEADRRNYLEVWEA